MGVQEFLNYESYIDFQNRQLQIWGQPCSIYVPNRRTNLGYEDVSQDEVNVMNSDEVLSTEYSRSEARIWINFTIPKSVFYKFNWFPEEGEELCMAVLNTTSSVREGDYIRTALPEATSIWGDMIFEVKKIQDVGLAQVLQRLYFLKVTSNYDLHRRLSF